jgi:CheY-like chemotaxis protein
MSGVAGKSVLVVEDDNSYRRLVARILSQAGLTVTTAEAFADAIPVIESAKPVDLLITDVGMPVGTPHGLAIGKMAALKRRGLRVLYMTGSYRPDQLDPDTPVLLKPFTASALIAAVESALARPLG